MVKQEIVEYIERETKRGVSNDRIKNALYKVGHDTNHVEEAFKHIKNKDKGKNILMISIVFLVVIVMVIAVLIIMGDSKPDDNNLIDPYADMTDSELLSKGSETKDLAYCEHIQNTEWREKCTVLANMPKIEYSDQDVEDRNNIIRAKNSGDQSYCDKIINQSLKDTCLEWVRT